MLFPASERAPIAPRVARRATGATLALAAEPPLRLEVAVPRPGAAAGAEPDRFYFCMRCLAEAHLTPSTNASAGCLFRTHKYRAAPLAVAAARHSCRYFAPAAMRALCDSLSREGDKPDHRGKTYAEQYFPWWCKADWAAEEAALS